VRSRFRRGVGRGRLLLELLQLLLGERVIRRQRHRATQALERLRGLAGLGEEVLAWRLSGRGSPWWHVPQETEIRSVRPVSIGARYFALMSVAIRIMARAIRWKPILPVRAAFSRPKSGYRLEV